MVNSHIFLVRTIRTVRRLSSIHNKQTYKIFKLYINLRENRTSFNFTDQSDVELSTLTTSDTITIGGINSTTTIEVTFFLKFWYSWPNIVALHAWK